MHVKADVAVRQMPPEVFQIRGGDLVPPEIQLPQIPEPGQGADAGEPLVLEIQRGGVRADILVPHPGKPGVQKRSPGDDDHHQQQRQ